MTTTPAQRAYRLTIKNAGWRDRLGSFAGGLFGGGAKAAPKLGGNPFAGAAKGVSNAAFPGASAGMKPVATAATAAAPAANPVAAAVGGNTPGWFARNRKAVGVGAAGLGAAAALGPTGIGADLGWRAGLVDDPARDVGYYTDKLNSLRQNFYGREISPRVQQYHKALEMGDADTAERVMGELDSYAPQYAGNTFSGAADAQSRAQNAWRKVQQGDAVKTNWWRPLVGGYSNTENANGYVRQRLKDSGIQPPLAYAGADRVARLARLPSVRNVSPDVGAWHPNRLNMPQQYQPGTEQSRLQELFQSAGLTH